MIVYLKDTDERGGPFECIPKGLLPNRHRLPWDRSRRVIDQDMEKVVPSHKWVSCTGTRGTLVFVDTCSVYHRGKAPEGSDRLAAFYCYNSRTPKIIECCPPLFSRNTFLSKTGQDLSDYQKACLFYPAQQSVTA